MLGDRSYFPFNGRSGKPGSSCLTGKSRQSLLFLLCSSKREETTIHLIICGGRHLIIYRETHFFARESCISNQGNPLFAREPKGNLPKGPKMLKHNYSRLREGVGGVLSPSSTRAVFFSSLFTAQRTVLLSCSLDWSRLKLMSDKTLWERIFGR